MKSFLGVFTLKRCSLLDKDKAIKQKTQKHRRKKGGREEKKMVGEKNDGLISLLLARAIENRYSTSQMEGKKKMQEKKKKRLWRILFSTFQLFREASTETVKSY